MAQSQTISKYRNLDLYWQKTITGITSIMEVLDPETSAGNDRKGYRHRRSIRR